MASGIFLFTSGTLQAQSGGGSSLGGAPTIGSGTGKLGESGNAMNQNRHHDSTPSGPMGEGRPESTRPGQGKESPLGVPDSSGGSPRVPGVSGPGAGAGSIGSGGSMGSGGGMGSSGGAGGGGK
jgi:hypothetical protein